MNMAQIYLHANTDRPGQSAPKIKGKVLEDPTLGTWAVLDIEAEGVTVAIHLSGVGAIADLARRLDFIAGQLEGTEQQACECGRGPILQGNMTPDVCAECYTGDVESVGVGQ